MKTIALLWLLPAMAFAQSYSIDWFTIAGGGGTSTGGPYSVSGTIGQSGLGPLLAAVHDPANCPDTRVHLLGHSFGARLVAYYPLSAIAEFVSSPVYWFDVFDGFGGVTRVAE